MLIISIIILILSIIVINKNQKNFIIYLFFIFLFLIITNIYIISDYFTWKWVDESFIYHLSYWIDWAWLKSDFYIISIWIGLFILTIIIPILIYKYLPKNITKFKSSLAFIILIIAFIVHPFTKNILELNWYFIKNKIVKTNAYTINTMSWKTFQDIYKLPKQQKSTLNNKNVIFVYLESFEKLYLDEELFPWLSNWLNNIKNESIYFDNINQAYWTSRTIAWMVWSQCGIPLINSWWWGNSMHWISSFLPWAFCTWDFLKNAWYDLNYIWWASLDFAWKWNFYKTHWFNSIKWKRELIPHLNNYFYDRWLYDDSLFDIAYEKYEKLSNKKEKFWLFILNLDTHWSKWVISKECNINNLKYNNDNSSILNSYHCTDYLLNNFITKIKQNKNFKDTIIVIASDHYAMSHNNSIDIIKKKEKEREMLFLIIDPSKQDQIIQKKWTTLDIWPTMLSVMWFDVNNLWLWVNLLNKETKTIQEEYNDFIFQKWKKDYESFWKYPSIKNWFEIDIINKKIHINNQKIVFPTIINLNENLEIEKILWDDTASSTKLSQKLYTNTIYIDSCNEIDISRKWFCILYTDKMWNKKINTIKNNEKISMNKLKNIFINYK